MKQQFFPLPTARKCWSNSAFRRAAHLNDAAAIGAGRALAEGSAGGEDRHRLCRTGRAAILFAFTRLPDPAFAKIVVLTSAEAAREALKERLRDAVADGLAPEACVRVTQLVFGPFPPSLSSFVSLAPMRAGCTRSPNKSLRSCVAIPTLGRPIGLGRSRAGISLRSRSGSAESDRPVAGRGRAAAAVPAHRHCVTQVRENIRNVSVVARSAGDNRLDPARLADFSLMSRDGRPDSARPDRPFRNPAGRTDHEAPRPHAGRHGSLGHQRSAAAPRSLEAGHEGSCSRLSHRFQLAIASRWAARSRNRSKPILRS